MLKIAKQLTLFYTAGSLGALANSLAVWLFGLLGITKALGVTIAPELTPTWLYPRIVWGGLWGILFLIPNLPHHPITKGLLLSLGPIIIQLFVVFPLKAQKGIMGERFRILDPTFCHNF